MFYIIFSLLGSFVDIEVRTPRGRVDVLLRTKTTLYVMELKLDTNSDANRHAHQQPANGSVVIHTEVDSLFFAQGNDIQQLQRCV